MKFVPIRHCDYIVIRVTVPGTDVEDARPPIRPQDLNRLGNVLSTAATADPDTLKSGLTSVLEDIGMIVSGAVKSGESKETLRKTGKLGQELEVIANSLSKEITSGN